MPVDAYAVTALAAELAAALEGGRIDKIYMPSKPEVLISGRAKSGPFRLLLSAHPQRARAHLTAIGRENPSSPPMFCMLLRKHLTNGRFAGLYQPRLERVLHFYWDAANEMGEISRKTLVIEMIGRLSNIILVDAEGRIIECLKRVDTEMSVERPVLPGLFYRDPPLQGKTDPLGVTAGEFAALYRMKQPADMPDSKWIGNTFTAIPPLLCEDIAMSSESIDDRFFDAMEYVKDNAYTPYLIKRGADFFSLPLKSVEQEIYGGTFSELLDELYTKRDQGELIMQKASSLTKAATKTKNKLYKKLGLLKQELHGAQEREHIRQRADLLMANLHLAKRGDEIVTVENFYDGGKPLTIKLDTVKSPQQNAAALYKAYAKAKKAEEALSLQIRQTESDAEYWESVLEQLNRVTCEKDLEEIREEIAPARQNTRTRSKTTKISEPARFRSSEGFIFRAGRNNRQNDLLTMKMASKNDIWLHAQKIPGCHVVIETRGEIPGERTLYEAAVVAAFYSAAKSSPKVEVDHTAVKFVKKPPNAKPGMVIYERFKTILAEPDGETVENLRMDK
jgi:predicted ribosome quality control (RQC) complex YloA/Tae2 family protein